MLLSITEDYILSRSKTENKESFIASVLNWINSITFTALLFPFTSLTAILFWTLYYLNSELIVPSKLLYILPLSGHVSIHLVIVLPLFTELLFANRQTVNRRRAICVLNTALFLYVLM